MHVLLIGDGAIAQTVVFGTGEVAVGGGHDTNIFLQVLPDAGTREPLVGGWFGRVAPTLAAALAVGEWRLETSYGLDYRNSREAGNLLLHEIDLLVTMPCWWNAFPRLVLSGGRFDASDRPQDQFLFAGGEIGLKLELLESFRLSVSYRAELRDHPEQPGGMADSDLVHMVELRLGYRSGARFELGMGSSYVGVAPARAALLDDGSVRLLRFGPDLELVWRRLTLVLGGWGGTLDVQGMPRIWQIGAGAGATFRITSHVDAVLAMDWTSSPGASDTIATNYTRRYVGLSLVAHATAKKAVTHSAERRPDKFGPIIENLGRVRLRLHAERATQVQVIGSWDDWAQSGRSLVPTGESGLWETWLELAPGSYRYRFVVDGKTVQPPCALRYVPDGFGGQDAVFEIQAKVAAP